MKPIESPHNREAAAIIAASRLKSKEEMQMHNTIQIQIRAYTVELRDIRTGETVKDSVILTKEQVKAAADTRLTLEGILKAVYERDGYRVTGISAPVKRQIAIGLCVNNEGEIVQFGVTYFLDGTPVKIEFPIRTEFLAEGKSVTALVPDSNA